MEENLPTRELLIAVVERGDAVLMRKKPAGSPPYAETWYSFGCDRVSGVDDQQTLKDYLKSALGIRVEIEDKNIPSAIEIKKDHDGILKKFIYTNFLCRYVEGDPEVPPGAEKVEWLPKSRLRDYDIVPPSVALFKQLSYF